MALISGDGPRLLLAGRDDRRRVHGGLGRPGQAERSRRSSMRHGSGHARGHNRSEGSVYRSASPDSNRYTQRCRGRRYRRPQDAQVLSLRRLGQHGLEDGGDQRGYADPHIPIDQGAALAVVQGHREGRDPGQGQG